MLNILPRNNLTISVLTFVVTWHKYLGKVRVNSAEPVGVTSGVTSDSLPNDFPHRNHFSTGKMLGIGKHNFRIFLL